MTLSKNTRIAAVALALAGLVAALAWLVVVPLGLDPTHRKVRDVWGSRRPGVSLPLDRVRNNTTSYGRTLSMTRRSHTFLRSWMGFGSCPRWSP